MPWMSVREQKLRNCYLSDNVSEQIFQEMRSKRDAGLKEPKLLHASLQANIRGGRLPSPSSKGERFSEHQSGVCGGDRRVCSLRLNIVIHLNCKNRRNMQADQDVVESFVLSPSLVVLSRQRDEFARTGMTYVLLLRLESSTWLLECSLRKERRHTSTRVISVLATVSPDCDPLVQS